MEHGNHRAERRPARRLRRRKRSPLVTTAASVASVALVGVLGAVTAGSSAAVPRSVLYVSTRGSDAASGRATAPLRTITAAVARTPAGGKIVVRSGSYHETLTLSGRAGRTITAAPGATVWLDGSRAVSGWVAAGSTWVSNGWTAQFDASPSFTAGAPDGPPPFFQFVNPAHPMAAHPDQVWLDGSPLNQVATRSQVGAGSFYVDQTAHQLVIGSNPAGHAVTASDLAKAISVREPNDTVSGINVRRYATSLPLIGTVTMESNRGTFRDAQVVENASTGLFATGRRNRVVDTTLARNGLLGFVANQATRLTLDRVRVVGNNTQQFNMAPSAGGAKITRSTHVVVRRSTFAGNDGTGLWFDLQNYDMRVLNDRFADNAGHGLFLEVSGTATVAGNVVGGNVGDGVKINNTDRVQLWNNTVTGNGRGIDIAQDNRDRTTPAAARRGLPMSLRSQQISLHNNVIGRPSSPQDCELCVEDFTHRFSAAALRVQLDGNVYQRPVGFRSRWLIVWSTGAGNPATYRSLRAFRRETHQERRGRVLARVSDLSQHPARLARRIALPVPAAIASEVGVTVGQRHLGAWIRS